MNVRNRRKQGIRHVSLALKWSSKVEHVAQQNLRAPGQRRSWTRTTENHRQHPAVVTEAKGARPAATVLQLCRRNGSRRCGGELSWPAFNDSFCELTTLHNYIIQVYTSERQYAKRLMEIERERSLPYLLRPRVEWRMSAWSTTADLRSWSQIRREKVTQAQSFTIVRSAILCLRGSRSRRRQLDFVAQIYRSKILEPVRINLFWGELFI